MDDGAILSRGGQNRVSGSIPAPRLGGGFRRVTGIAVLMGVRRLACRPLRPPCPLSTPPTRLQMMKQLALTQLALRAPQPVEEQTVSRQSTDARTHTHAARPAALFCGRSPAAIMCLRRWSQQQPPPPTALRAPKVPAPLATWTALASGAARRVSRTCVAVRSIQAPTFAQLHTRAFRPARTKPMDSPSL
eukprot:COSAG02_NODE_1579_length_11851_cov_12.490343_8_plen_190_part_00